MATYGQKCRQVARKSCTRPCSVEMDKVDVSSPKKQKKCTSCKFDGSRGESSVVVSSSSATLSDCSPQKKDMSSDLLSGYKIPKKKGLTSKSSSKKKTKKNEKWYNSGESDTPSTSCDSSSFKEPSPYQHSSDTRNENKIICRDISNEREMIPIPVINNIDSEKPPDDFFYVTHSRANEIYYLDSNTVVYCKCKDNCFSDTCPCGKDSVKCWYNKNGKLTNKFFQLKIMPLIFECNRYCHCGLRSCKNRVVQRGIQLQLQLFRTHDMGWGVRTVHMIARGSFVCEYVGELVTDKEANDLNDNYLFDLEKNKERDIAFCLDGTTYGNISRFINHFCDANLIPIRVFVEHQDLNCPHIALFAIRDIKPFEQLGFDYGEKFWSVKNKYFSCKCASSKCKYSTILSDEE